MNAKQIKRLRHEMKKRFKFTLSQKDGYKPDLRVGQEVEKTLFFHKIEKKFIKFPKDALELELCEVIKTKRFVAVNTAKTQYKMAKKGLKAALKG
jgi:hypothetical protein